jgi:hypothetical protein
MGSVWLLNLASPLISSVSLIISLSKVVKKAKME